MVLEKPQWDVIYNQILPENISSGVYTRWPSVRVQVWISVHVWTCLLNTRPCNFLQINLESQRKTHCFTTRVNLTRTRFQIKAACWSNKRWRERHSLHFVLFFYIIFTLQRLKVSNFINIFEIWINNTYINRSFFVFGDIYTSRNI
jgi:hypothetical protein